MMPFSTQTINYLIQTKGQALNLKRLLGSRPADFDEGEWETHRLYYLLNYIKKNPENCSHLCWHNPNELNSEWRNLPSPKEREAFRLQEEKSTETKDLLIKQIKVIIELLKLRSKKMKDIFLESFNSHFSFFFDTTEFLGNALKTLVSKILGIIFIPLKYLCKRLPLPQLDFRQIPTITILNQWPILFKAHYGIEQGNIFNQIIDIFYMLFRIIAKILAVAISLIIIAPCTALISLILAIIKARKIKNELNASILDLENRKSKLESQINNLENFRNKFNNQVASLPDAIIGIIADYSNSIGSLFFKERHKEYKKIIEESDPPRINRSISQTG